RAAPRLLPLGHRGGEAKETAHPLGQTTSIHLDAAAPRTTLQAAQKDEQTAVPAGEILRVDHDAPDVTAPLELPCRLRRRQQTLAQPPAARQAQADGIRRRRVGLHLVPGRRQLFHTLSIART